MIVTADSYPFNLLLQYSKMSNLSTSDEVIIEDLNYIMTQLNDKDRNAMVSAINTLLVEAEVKK
jgi:hypothetical protein